jgi:hypothetical protein
MIDWGLRDSAPLSRISQTEQRRWQANSSRDVIDATVKLVPEFEELRGVPPQLALAVLHKCFQDISQMSSDDLVAAYQALSAYTAESGMNHPMIDRIFDALIIQMRHKSWGYGASERFASVIGDNLRRWVRFRFGI